MNKVHHPNSEYPGFLIRRLQQLSSANFMNSLRDFQLTPIQYTILRVLEDNPGIDQRTVAIHAALDTSTTTDVLRRLASRKLVSRTQGLIDKRIRIVRLTKSGQKLLETVRPIVGKARRELLSPLSPAKQETLIVSIITLLEAYAHEQANEEENETAQMRPAGRPWKRGK